MTDPLAQFDRTNPTQLRYVAPEVPEPEAQLDLRNLALLGVGALVLGNSNPLADKAMFVAAPYLIRAAAAEGAARGAALYEGGY